MKRIEDIYVKELEDGKTIRVCEDGVRISLGKKSMYYKHDWEEIAGLRNVKQRVERLNDRGIDVDRDIRLDYPLNVFHDMGTDLEREYEIEGVTYYLDVKDIEDNFDERLEKCGLLPRELACIRSYYRELKSLEQMGRELDITRERTRQILAKAIRRLKMPVRIKTLLGIRTVNYEEAVEEAIRKRVDERWNEMMSSLPEKAVEYYERHRNDDAIIHATKGAGQDMDIEDLNLSVRSYNCLRRHGLYKVSQILPIAADDEKMLRIRNLGRRSLKEIRERLTEKGFEWKGSR